MMRWNALLLVSACALLTAALPPNGMPRARAQDPPEQSGTPDTERQAVIKQAIEFAEAARFDEAIKAVDGFAPAAKDVELSMLLLRLLDARAEQVSGDSGAAARPYHHRTADVLRRLDRLGAVPEQAKPNVAFIVYREAAAYAAEGKPDQALRALGEAFTWGLDDADQPAHDPDLQSLADNPAFKKLLREAGERIARRLAAETRQQLSEFESFDFDFALTDTKGTPIALADFRGKVLIVDFWGTWCGPCIQEIPAFVKLKQHYGPKGLEIIGLNYEHGDDTETHHQNISRLQNELKMNYRCALVDEETIGQVPELSGFPTTLFIDRQGQVRLMLVGAHSHGKLESIVQQLLEGSPAAGAGGQ